MNEFINEDFLLKNKKGKEIYHNYIKNLPIIDYHCHLDPKEIYDNIFLGDLGEAWLAGDHYKWRLMRTNGISEDYITGSKSSYEKYLKWAETVPYLIGNPIYHWTHMELKQFFNISDLFNPNTAKDIYDKANQILKRVSVRDLIYQSKVEVIITTDDPIDDLKYHQLLTKEENRFKVLPGFRPDKAINLELYSFSNWIIKLSDVVGYEITSYDTLQKALKERIKYFNDNGSIISDHGLDVILYEEATLEELNIIFNKALNNEILTKSEIAKYKGNLLTYLGTLYYEVGWIQQYHIGANRNNSTRMLKELGVDKGYDSINDKLIAEPLSKVLDSLDEVNKLPKTIIYTLNPRDFEVAITLMQSFQTNSEVPGKIQFGASWWFLDQKNGIEKHLEALGNNGMLAHFVGMLTDSRSYLSYVRHDYFRRILANYLGNLIEDGLFPNDIKLIGDIASNISYYNAKKYFKI